MRARRATGVFVVVVLVAGTFLFAGPVSAAAQCAPAEHRGGDWPVYGHDLSNTRNQVKEKVIGTDNVTELTPEWVFSVADAGGGGTFESTPMVADGCVFIATQAGEVFALNADTGELVWEQELPATVTTLSVANGRVFADVSRMSSPFMVALDQKTGKILWKTTLSKQKGSDVTGSPVAFGDLVATGVSCIGAEGASGEDRLACRGAFTILDQASGKLLATAYGIPKDDFEDGYAGGGMWAAPAIDMATGYAYEGAGNPFSAREHPRTNAILKIDVDPSRKTFGQVVDSYKATSEQYLPLLGSTKPLCEESGSQFGICEFPDLDMAMAATIFESRGVKLVGAGQSAGIWHAARADTMEYVWTTATGPPLLGSRSGGSAYDGETIYTSGGYPGHLWALEKERGDPEWTAPATGPTSWTAVGYANGVVYIPTGGEGKATLMAYDAETGAPLLARPMGPDVADVATGMQAGGVSIARNNIYAPVNGPGGGHLVAYGLGA